MRKKAIKIQVIFFILLNFHRWRIFISFLCGKNIVHKINVFSVPIKDRANCNASFHSIFHEHLWSHDAGKACNREDHITQTTNILQIHEVFVLNIHMVWHDFFVFQILIYNVYLRCNVPRSYVSGLLGMQWGAALRPAFHRGRENIYE